MTSVKSQRYGPRAHSTPDFSANITPAMCRALNGEVCLSVLLRVVPAVSVRPCCSGLAVFSISLSCAANVHQLTFRSTLALSPTLDIRSSPGHKRARIRVGDYLLDVL